MLQTLKNAWKTKEIRNKILFTLLILLLYRIGTVIPVPFVNGNAFSNQFGGTILEYMNTLSGGALQSTTLFALGVSPYINASIIIQLLAVVFPKLGEIAKTDKAKMNFITRIVTVILAIVTAIGYYFLIMRSNALVKSATPGEGDHAWIYAVVIVACYCAGASIIMWLGERINEKGIGNGISLILFANIISSIPSFIYELGRLIVSTFADSKNAALYGTLAVVFAVVLIAVLIALIIFVIWITGSERRISVRYAKQIRGRKMYGGQNQNLPIKVNMTGVMPIIFASSIVSLVPTILTFAGVSTTNGWYKFFAAEGVFYPICLFVLIIAFTYFYTQITFDPIEVANRIKSQGGTIAGIRQGKPTSDFIKNVLGKVTLVGALFLGIIAVLPVVGGPHVISHILTWFNNGINVGTSQINVSQLTATFTFGGTTLLILVGVVLETFRELEAQLTMRNYKGFL